MAIRTVRDLREGQIKLEAVDQPLYSLGEMKPGSFDDHFLGFFHYPENSDESNVIANSLMWPKRFSIKKICVKVNANADESARADFYSVSSFVFRMGEKDYFRAPMSRFWDGVFEYSNDKVERNTYELSENIFISPEQYFSVTINFPEKYVAQINDLDIWVFLEGELLREIC